MVLHTYPVLSSLFRIQIIVVLCTPVFIIWRTVLFDPVDAMGFVLRLM